MHAPNCGAVFQPHVVDILSPACSLLRVSCPELVTSKTQHSFLEEAKCWGGRASPTGASPWSGSFLEITVASGWSFLRGCGNLSEEAYPPFFPGEGLLVSLIKGRETVCNATKALVSEDLLPVLSL